VESAYTLKNKKVLASEGMNILTPKIIHEHEKPLKVFEPLNIL
jgi:hypothetical protein